MEYETGEAAVDTRSRKIRRTATDFEDTLKIHARNDVTKAGDMLLKLVRHQNKSEVKNFFTSSLTISQRLKPKWLPAFKA
jgi:hypothetical protein